ncbi:MAG: hypothetical protein R3B70_24215, partial [Polyangiaceae bacterium]
VLSRGTPADLADLPPAHHGKEHADDFRARLGAGEEWTIARLDGRIVHYFWISTSSRCNYPSLPGCLFELEPDTGYGHDAWTDPELRGSGIRRCSFLRELNRLRELGKDYEASFFVAYQLEGATRSLATVGIVVEPLWKICLLPDRSLQFEQLTPTIESAWPDPDAPGRRVLAPE